MCHLLAPPPCPAAALSYQPDDTLTVPTPSPSATSRESLFTTAYFHDRDGLAALEQDPAMAGATSHLLAIGTRPSLPQED